MFIVFNYPYSLARHSAVLLAPLVLISRSGWDTWLQARGYTLAFYFMIRCTIYTRLLLLTNVRIRHSVDQARILQVLSFAGVATLLAINNFMFQSININGIYKQNSPWKLQRSMACISTCQERRFTVPHIFLHWRRVPFLCSKDTRAIEPHKWFFGYGATLLFFIIMCIVCDISSRCAACFILRVPRTWLPLSCGRVPRTCRVDCWVFNV